MGSELSPSASVKCLFSNHFKSPGVKILCALYDMETTGTKSFIPKGFEMSTTLS